MPVQGCTLPFVTARVLQVTLYVAVDMKDNKEDRQRGSNLQDYGLLSFDVV